MNTQYLPDILKKGETMSCDEWNASLIGIYEEQYAQAAQMVEQQWKTDGLANCLVCESLQGEANGDE